MKDLRKVLLGVLVIVFVSSLVTVVSAASFVSLNSAGSFAVLAGSTITNVGNTVINGDLGLTPGSVVSGFPPGVVNGFIHVEDTSAILAQIDLTTAFNNAAGQAVTSTIPSELGSSAKTAGIYDSADGTFGITGTLTLDAQGNPDAIFIFKTNTTLTTQVSSNVTLTNGAQACNVFWQVGSSATLGVNSTFKGNLLVFASATLNTGAAVEGRILARNAAVTLDSNVITKAICVAPPDPDPDPDPDPPDTTPPLISVSKVPSPLALTDGAGTVTYDYLVSNIGTVAMYNVTIADNKCDPVDFISGDDNSDSKLDISEVWSYSCTTFITQTTTNTVTVSGDANGFTSTDTANATVAVTAPLAPPLIHLVKTPNTFLRTASGPVTYSYYLTNPGTIGLSDVSVVDDKCSPISFNSGDTNHNDILDTSETWIYSCLTNLSITTTNTAIGEGSGNGLTAIDYALATVVVTIPELLANTGGIAADNKPVIGIVILLILSILCIIPGLKWMTVNIHNGNAKESQ